MHGFFTDDWEEWFTANQIEFVPEPSNSSTTTSALDLAPFGEEQKLTNKINNAVSMLYANDRITNYVLNTETLELEVSNADTRSAFHRAGGVYHPRIMLFYLTICNVRYRAKKNHTQHASYPGARVYPVHIQKFGVGCTGNEIQSKKRNLLSICLHASTFICRRYS
jgi:hypothetical protein